LPRLQNIILFLAGLTGLSGVALAAAATHLGDRYLLGNASLICLSHAPVLLGLVAVWTRVRTAPIAAVVLFVGILFFSGDLVARHFTNAALFPMAAPSGGVLMMAGWLLISLGAFFVVKPER
jgi:uncharacterized membrane protein YgdD (TMEM256/DUF423 family)